MVFGVIVRCPQDTLIEAGVINGSVRSDGFANLWVRSDLDMEMASVDLLVVWPNLGLHGSQ